MLKTSPPPHPSLWLAMLLTAMAGGMGWGIRGQYGHETGAMIAGVLVGLVLVLLFHPQGTSLSAARAVALTTVAISLGGSMTYGQTIGLTQNPPLVGNWAALRWGLLGLFLKGAIWIGFAGAFLGLALSDRPWRLRDWVVALALMLGLYCLGIWLLNEPFDPARRVLPKIYFSADWRWEPGADLKPRRERWGGLLLALLGLLLYAGPGRAQRLAWRLGLWGMLGGGLGFSLGQCLQAFHAWNPELFRDGWISQLDPHLNWWNFMETTFGAVFGAILGLGLWLNRNLVSPPREPLSTVLSPAAEALLLLLHAGILFTWQFASFPAFDAITDMAIPTVIIPILAICGGRYWPFLLALPVTAMPIVGKTLLRLCYEEHQIAPALGWVLYVALPLIITTVAALWLARRAHEPDQAPQFARVTLLGVTWLYFGLNFAFFQFPWPWQNWTARTPNALVFLVCALGLTMAAVRYRRPPAFP